MDRTNSEGEDIILGIIRGEAGVDEDEISSFLNASGDGQELEQVDEGQTNNDDEGQTNNDDGPSTTTGEVYIY